MAGRTLGICLECRRVFYAEGYRFSVPWGTDCGCPKDPEMERHFRFMSEKERERLRGWVVNTIYRMAMKERERRGLR
jgi:hypothetical protein